MRVSVDDFGSDLAANGALQSRLTLSIKDLNRLLKPTLLDGLSRLELAVDWLLRKMLEKLA